MKMSKSYGILVFLLLQEKYDILRKMIIWNIIGFLEIKMSFNEFVEKKLKKGIYVILRKSWIYDIINRLVTSQGQIGNFDNI